MKKVAIQTAGYLYFALAAILALSALLNLFDDGHAHLFVATVLGIAAAFCGYMGVKSRTFLRMALVPSRAQIAGGIALSMAIGALAGHLLVIVLLVPYGLLLWAVQPRAT